jgi:hypothetical protein
MTKHLAMKVFRGHGSEVPCILNLTITSKERAAVPTLDRRLSGPQSQLGHGDKEKSLYPYPCQESKPSHSAYIQSLYSLILSHPNNK